MSSVSDSKLERRATLCSVNRNVLQPVTQQNESVDYSEKRSDRSTKLCPFYVPGFCWRSLLVVVFFSYLLKDQFILILQAERGTNSRLGQYGDQWKAKEGYCHFRVFRRRRDYGHKTSAFLGFCAYDFLSVALEQV